MYTLEKVIEMTKTDVEPYCRLYKGFRCCGEGWLSELDLDNDTRIERYRVEYDSLGRCLILHLA